MIHLPRYLDLAKLRDVAEYLAMPTEEQIAIERTAVAGTASRLGVSRAVDVGSCLRGVRRDSGEVPSSTWSGEPVE